MSLALGSKAIAVLFWYSSVTKVCVVWDVCDSDDTAVSRESSGSLSAEDASVMVDDARGLGTSCDEITPVS